MLENRLDPSVPDRSPVSTFLVQAEPVQRYSLLSVVKRTSLPWKFPEPGSEATTSGGRKVLENREAPSVPVRSLVDVAEVQPEPVLRYNLSSVVKNTIRPSICGAPGRAETFSTGRKVDGKLEACRNPVTSVAEV